MSMPLPPPSYTNRNGFSTAFVKGLMALTFGDWRKTVIHVATISPKRVEISGAVMKSPSFEKTFC